MLNLITTSRPISRVEIARRTTLTKQTISNLTDELVEAGLVLESGIRREGVGKPSKMLELNPSGAFTLGVKVGSTEIEAGLYSITGEAVKLRQFPLATLDPATLTDTLAQVCETSLHETPREKILGVGLVLPPPQSFNRDTHKHPAGVLTDMVCADIRAALAERLGLPIVSESVAAAVAASEMLHGAARDLESFVYLHMGNSLEAGIVFNRQLLSGYNGITGRIGHVIVQPGGPVCDCGNRGCLDLFASLNSLARAFGSKLRPGQKCSDLLADPEQHKALLDPWFTRMSEPMRIGFNMVENLINPQTVILGGDVPAWFIDQCIRRLRPFIPSVAQFGEREIPRFIRAPQMADMAVRGAATLPVYAAICSGERPQIHGQSQTPTNDIQSLVYA
ncbi:ROK family transcriptional regulator [Gilvimarinus algae]|uniref:ROK family transcriptional regulator n=1 Tax=Gilvimarinus algae TaxID=3058037 RepID=A0ABT8TBH9_9GAMM|nr:ROK family transcriptional regulator [Gilvimarinus sp. SDUM040014]MDO3381467.1 ROK family transcriptional regulator [Gilvimarinus sp. SDUM040014]